LNLESLAIAYGALGRTAETEGLLRRSLAIREQRFGPDNPDVAQSLHMLADVYREQGKYDDAQELYGRALRIREQTIGPKHVNTAQTLLNLGDAYRGQRKYVQAEELYNRALAVQEEVGSAGRSGMVWTLIRLASIRKSSREYDKALELYERALAIAEPAVGTSHPDLAYLLDDLAILHRAMGHYDQALAFSRRASASILAHAAQQPASLAQRDGYGGLVEQRATYFVRHVFNLARVAQEHPDQDPAAGREAFEIAQWGILSRSAAAVQQMGARFASGDDALASLVRQSQDLAVVLREQNRTLVEALSKTTNQRDQAVDNLRREIADAEGRLSQIARELEARFPEYVTLAQPRPLSVEQVQRLLGPDDAFVFFMTGESSGAVFALTRGAFSWKPVALGTSDLNRKVADLRRGLEVEVIDGMYENIDEDRAAKLFDLGLAHDLYRDLLLPVEALIRDKRQLIVVPSGALTSLPFHLLVTEEPTDAVPDRFAGYRDASWLIKRQAVSVIPAVTSVQTLQGTSRTDARARPMIGFGDPVFDRAEAEIAALRPSGTSVTRGYADFWRGAGIDRTELSRLPRLPDTGDELKIVAGRLGAPSSDIHLREAASESAVKRLPLADYRVIYFATHGLVAGDVEGVAEPALALSMPANPTDDDDGLLTASEVAQLKLNADWVVLSACNTVAGEKPGAEALSGLARAFFYSGARSLLVSHWRVDSFAATALTTATFGFLERDSTLGRSEALRRAMLEFMNDSADPRRAYPALWAPFVIIGRDAPAHDNAPGTSAPPARRGKQE
jgi:CHAT domain-containing protein